MNAFSLVDGGIIFGFIIFNLIAIFFTRHKPRTLREVAQGTGYNKLKEFPLVLTIVATFCSSSLFVNGIEQTYMGGLKYIIYVVLLVLSAALVIFIVIPKMVHVGSLTFFEWMGYFYGKNIRTVMAIGEFLGNCGFFAVQLRLIVKASQIAFGCDKFTCDIIMITATIILIFYSAYGGLSAVARTDVIQFFFFFTVILILCMRVLVVEHENGILILFSGHDPKMQIQPLFSNFDVAIATISLWIKGIFPPLCTQQFQRITITKNKWQGMRIWGLAVVIYGLAYFLVTLIGLQVLAATGGKNLITGGAMQQNDLLPYIANKYNFAGLKGLIFVCMVSLGMSTADSVLNSLGLIAANDILPNFSEKTFPRTCRSVMIATFIIGGIALLLALTNSNLFKLLMFTSCLYMPVISIPLLLTILGLRTHKNSIWAGIICGAITTISYMVIAALTKSKYYEYAFGPGIIMNLVAILVTHLYYIKVKGWKNVKEEPNLSMFVNEIYQKEDIDIVKTYRDEFVEAMRAKYFRAYNPTDIEIIMKSICKPRIRKEQEYIAYRNAVYTYFIKEPWTEQEIEINEYKNIIKFDLSILMEHELRQYCKENSIEIDY